MGLQKHANNMGICTEICWAVRNLAPFEGNRERYALSNSLRRVLSAASHSHPSADPSHIPRSFANELLPETIAAVFKTHLASEVFAKEACRALVACIAGEEDDVIGRVAIAGAGALVLKVTSPIYTRYTSSPSSAPPCHNLTAAPRSKVPSPISFPGPRSTCPHLTHCPVPHPHVVRVRVLLLLLLAPLFPRPSRSTRRARACARTPSTCSTSSAATRPTWAASSPTTCSTPSPPPWKVGPAPHLCPHIWRPAPIKPPI